MDPKFLNFRKLKEITSNKIARKISNENDIIDEEVIDKYSTLMALHMAKSVTENHDFIDYCIRNCNLNDEAEVVTKKLAPEYIRKVNKELGLDLEETLVNARSHIEGVKTNHEYIIEDLHFGNYFNDPSLRATIDELKDIEEVCIYEYIETILNRYNIINALMQIDDIIIINNIDVTEISQYIDKKTVLENMASITEVNVRENTKFEVDEIDEMLITINNSLKEGKDINLKYGGIDYTEKIRQEYKAFGKIEKEFIKNILDTASFKR